MYDEKDMEEMNNNLGNGDENRQEPKPELTTNFIMRDPDPQPVRQTESQDSLQAETYTQNQQEPQIDMRQQYQQEFRQDSFYSDQNHGRPVYDHIPEEPDKKRKKKGTAAARIAGITAAALLFGTVAGGTMFGVNYLGEQLTKETYPQVSQVPSVSSVSQESGNPTQAITTSTGDVSDIVEKAMPSVVAITNTMVYKGNSFFGQTQTYEVPSSGSGIIINQNDSELLIVTNNHVVEDSTSLKVTFIDNTTADAAIKGTDPETDLAVIAVPLSSISSETFNQISIANLGNSDDLKVGQGVVAIGNALGYGQSVTVGYISALNRAVTTEDQVTHDLLQTDAAINPGNSGGALLNMQGEVIGINAAKYSSTEVEGMGYAIPISKAQEIIGELSVRKTKIAVDEQDQGYLGIQGQNIDQAMAEAYGMPRGIYIYKIVEDSAAAKSDLREKDIITKFDSQTVRSMSDLKDMLTYYENGSTVTLTVQSLENGQYSERQVEITLGKRPTEAQ